MTGDPPATIDAGGRSPDGIARFGHRQTRIGKWWDDHPRLLRLIALVAVSWTAVYLVWRIGWSLDGRTWPLGVALLVTELFGWWSLGCLMVFSWTKVAQHRPPPTPGLAVDIYVCTYDESVDVLRATLVGCSAVRYPHVTWLLDDGRRPELAALAAELGAMYLTRADNTHAKAGNINHAITRTSGELVLILDADHIPLPDALDAVVGHFDDPRCAVVQTPHDFYNQDSVQHYQPGRHEQSVFFEVVCPGKDRHGAAFWCGSAGIVRREALLGIGGVATETIAEDFHTTIRMQLAGWTTRYHHETIVQGLAPHDLSAYLLQRDRWARGNLAVFTTPESPLRARRLTLMQRWSYFASLSAYLAGPMRGLALLVLGIVLWTGQLPLLATWWSIWVLWLPATLLTIMAGSALSRGHMTIKEAYYFEISTMAIHLRALRCIVRPGTSTFKVTPKEGTDAGGWTAIRQLLLAAALLTVLATGILARAATSLDWIGLPHLPAMAAWLVPVLGGVEATRMWRTLRHLSHHHQTRADYRFLCHEPASLGGVAGHVTDLSRHGASISTTSRPSVGEVIDLRLRLPDATGARHELATQARVRVSRGSGDQHQVGLQFIDPTPSAIRSITEFCFVVCVTERLRGLPPHLLPQPGRALRSVAIDAQRVNRTFRQVGERAALRAVDPRRR